MGIPLRALIVEDSEDDALLIIRVLQKGGYDLTYERVDTADAMREAIGRETWDIVISDFNMPHFSGSAALTLCKEKGLDIPFILVSGAIGEETAVAAMLSGAHDYVMKTNLPRLVPAIQRELREAESRRERKRAEERIIESEERYRNLFVESTDAIMTLEPPDWKFTSGNPATIKMFKVNGEAEFLSYEPWQLSPWTQPDGRVSAEKAREMIETAMREGANCFEWVHKRRNGEEFYTEVLLSRVVQTKKAFLHAVVRDITERKQAEEMKRAREIAEAASRSKSDFLANMSHGLRTPLNSINGFSEVLYDGTFGPLNEKQKQFVKNILTSGKHLLMLINQILDMAKAEAGKMKLDLSNLPMKGLLNEISMLVAEMVRRKKLQMMVEIAEDIPNIEADELRVREILYNLLSNAIKFTPEGGKIGMRAGQTDSEIEIVVWDTGVGIAPENMEKIFEGFFRVDTPYSRVTEGTGLGLPLSKRLVELHGGKLSVESEGLNKGASVRFTLPIVSGKAV